MHGGGQYWGANGGGGPPPPPRSGSAAIHGDGSTSGRTIALGVKVGSGVFFPNEVRFFTSTNGGGEWKSLNTSTHTLYTNGSLTFVPGSATGYACSFLPPTSACDQ